VAEEILTPYGEIMGMFLKETIHHQNLTGSKANLMVATKQNQENIKTVVTVVLKEEI
jgi:hypothetical protein